MGKILDLGCGNRKLKGAIGIDINPNSFADIIYDLNKIPYPFRDSIFDGIYADNIIEHLDNVIRTMEELHRISKPQALIKIKVPYFRARWAFIDPTHKHFFTTESFSYFEPRHIHNKLYNYSSVNFKIERIIFNEGFIVQKNIIGCINNCIKYFANKHITIYESYISHIFPLDQLSFDLRVIK